MRAKALYHVAVWPILCTIVTSACGASTKPTMQPAAQMTAEPTAEPTTATTDEKPVVALIKWLCNEHHHPMEDAAIAHAAERGDVELKVFPQCEDSEAGAWGQITIIRDMIAQEADAIIISMMEPPAILPELEKAIDAGIVVITIDDMPPDQTTMDMLGLDLDLPFVGPDIREGAKLAGEALGEALGEGGKVIIIEGDRDPSFRDARMDGFMDSIDEHGLKLLASGTAEWSQEQVYVVVSNLIATHPDVQGIMCHSDRAALGAIEAVESAGRTGDILVVGYGNTPSAQDAMREGTLLATIDPFPLEIVPRAIDYAMRVLATGEESSGWQTTEVELITAEDE